MSRSDGAARITRRAPLCKRRRSVDIQPVFPSRNACQRGGKTFCCRMRLRGLMHVKAHCVTFGDYLSILYNNNSPRAAAVGLAIEALFDDDIEFVLFRLW